MCSSPFNSLYSIFQVSELAVDCRQMRYELAHQVDSLWGSVLTIVESNFGVVEKQYKGCQQRAAVAERTNEALTTETENLKIELEKLKISNETVSDTLSQVEKQAEHEKAARKRLEIQYGECKKEVIGLKMRAREEDEAKGALLSELSTAKQLVLEKEREADNLHKEVILAKRTAEETQHRLRAEVSKARF